MSKHVLIGITGLKQTGKQTIANYLTRKYGFRKRGFSEPVKEICKIMFNFNSEQVDGNKKDEPDKNCFSITPREMMQFVEIDLFKKQMNRINAGFDEKIFIAHFEQWYDEYINSQESSLVVVPDIYLQNQAESIHSKGGFVIKVIFTETPGNIEKTLFDRFLDFFGMNSSNDGDDISYDEMVVNGHDYSFKELYQKVDDILEKHEILIK